MKQVAFLIVFVALVMVYLGHDKGYNRPLSVHLEKATREEVLHLVSEQMGVQLVKTPATYSEAGRAWGVEGELAFDLLDRLGPVDIRLAEEEGITRRPLSSRSSLGWAVLGEQLPI